MEKEKIRQKSKGENQPRSIKKIVISIVVIIVAIVSPFLIYFGMQIALNTNSPLTVVVSGSMEPTYHKGDLLVLYGEDPANINVGDVIVFNAYHWPSPPSEPVVHRVVDKQFNSALNRWEFQTKGDANPTEDPGWVPEDSIIGKVVGWVPFIGWVKIFLTEGNLLIPLIVIIIIILIISLLWDVIKKEEDEENQEKNQKVEGKDS
ncbi:MAG: signal peptidase I [Promethearchaeota archaeon]|nr:MAG: signal peptidase I [Candidatus Lokiarchaeota archaeon]